ncbi:MAG: type II toxin-antitoxin system HicA family toxin [Roseiflexaceae bacterium]|nr:type II toxin-antitoxin system HicA family toxin [Roseiflexaceae bacterium]
MRLFRCLPSCELPNHHPNKPGRVTVPHPKKDLPVGTLRSIYRQAGWSWSEKE